MSKISSFQGGYRFLSNFWPSHIVYEGLLYPTLEHAYAASKVESPHVKKMIQNCQTPGKAKSYLDDHNLKPDHDWTIPKKLRVMEKLLLIKFGGKEPFLTRSLIATGDCYLEEGNTWEDTFWGTCQGVGKNHLGYLLMEVRGTLVSEKTEIIRQLKEHNGSRKAVAESLKITIQELYEKTIAYEIDGEWYTKETSSIKLEQYHRAAQLIEENGLEGVNSASNLIGTEMAILLLVVHFRRNLGSMETYPAREGIKEKVNEILMEKKIILS